MPSIRVNLQEAVQFTELADGTYPCEVAEISDVQKGAKAQYVTATLVVADGEENAGAKCWTNLPIEGKGAGIFLSFYNAAMGTDHTIEEFEDGDLEIDTDELIGCEVNVIIKQEEYPEGSGEMKAKVHKVLPSGV